MLEWDSNLVRFRSGNFLEPILLSVNKVVKVFDQDPSHQIRICDAVDWNTKEVETVNLAAVGLLVHVQDHVIGMFALKNY